MYILYTATIGSVKLIFIKEIKINFNMYDKKKRNKTDDLSLN